MKILLVNKYYYMRGGDCTHVFALTKLLKSKGHTVRHFSVHNPKNLKYEYDGDFVSYIDFQKELNRTGVKPKLRVLGRMLYSQEARSRFRKILAEFKPDIVHFHNIHKHITTSILLEANKQHIPVIWTLHDYNLICPNISFLSHNHLCEKCKRLGYAAPMLERCSNNSWLASGMITVEKLLHDLQGVRNRVTCFISPSNFLKNKFVEYGFPEKKIVVIPNFYPLPKKSGNIAKNRYYLYIGRLSPEKGIETLCKAARLAGISLIVAGDGLLKADLEAKYASSTLKFVGFKTGKELEILKRNAWFVVIPSEWYENNPYSVIEAFAVSVPVIGANIGGIPELVRENKTGYLFESGNEANLSGILKMTSKMTISKRNEMGKAARTLIVENNSPEVFYSRIISIYQKAIKEAN